MRLLNVCIVFSKKDQASMNIYHRISSMIKNKGFNYKNINVYFFVDNIEHIKNDNVDKKIMDKLKIKPDIIIFASKHKSEEGVDCLTVHPIGNIDKAVLGGKEKQIVGTSALFLTILYKRLSSKSKEFGYGWDVNFEQTHHGPFLETPSIFIEIGSNREAWINEKNGHIISKTLEKSLEDIDRILSKIGAIVMNSKSNGVNKRNKKKGEINEIISNEIINNEIVINIVFGSGHYNKCAERCLKKYNGFIGHIVSRYYIDKVDKDILEQLDEKSYFINKEYDSIIFRLMESRKRYVYDKKSLGKAKVRDKFLELIKEYHRGKEL